MAKAHMCPRCRTPWPTTLQSCPLCQGHPMLHVRAVEPLSEAEAESVVKHHKFEAFWEARQATREKSLIDTLEAAYGAEDAPDGP